MEKDLLLLVDLCCYDVIDDLLLTRLLCNLPHVLILPQILHGIFLFCYVKIIWIVFEDTHFYT